jgi:hypothetical protein
LKLPAPRFASGFLLRMVLFVHCPETGTPMSFVGPPFGNSK